MNLNKKILEQFIQKYYLGGLINSATIKSTGTNISARVVNEFDNVIIEVSTSEVSLPQGEYHIYDSAAFLAILNVLGDTCSVNVDTNKDGVPSSLSFDDGTTKATFVLAHGSIIKKAMAMKITPTVDIGCNLPSEFGVQFSRAFSALPDAKMYVVQSDGEVASLTVNYEEKRNTTRVTLPLVASPNAPIPTLYFPTQYMAAMLKANALSLKAGTGRFEISNVRSGFARLSFPEFSTVYNIIGALPN